MLFTLTEHSTMFHRVPTNQANSVSREEPRKWRYRIRILGHMKRY